MELIFGLQKINFIILILFVIFIYLNKNKLNNKF